MSDQRLKSIKDAVLRNALSVATGHVDDPSVLHLDRWSVRITRPAEGEPSQFDGFFLDKSTCYGKSEYTLWSSLVSVQWACKQQAIVADADAARADEDARAQRLAVMQQAAQDRSCKEARRERMIAEAIRRGQTARFGIRHCAAMQRAALTDRDSDQKRASLTAEEDADLADSYASTNRTCSLIDGISAKKQSAIDEKEQSRLAQIESTKKSRVAAAMKVRADAEDKLAAQESKRVAQESKHVEQETKRVAGKQKRTEEAVEKTTKKSRTKCQPRATWNSPPPQLLRAPWDRAVTSIDMLMAIPPSVTSAMASAVTVRDLQTTLGATKGTPAVVAAIKAIKAACASAGEKQHSVQIVQRVLRMLRPLLLDAANELGML